MASRASLAGPRPSLGGLGAATANRQSVSGRHSMAPKRHSTMGVADDARRSRGMSLGGRRSSVMPAGGRKVEDPRPIRDKAYMSKSIRKLIVYLSEHGYDRSISSQILTSPTTKDFLSIISFLLASIDPNFKFVGKFEDEIPAMLKLISYPTTVGRSALTAIGNPTSWPQLLAVLSWLTDLLKYAEVISEKEADENFDNEDGHKMFVDYLTRAYALFLAGEDDTSALEEEVAFVFDTKNAQLRQETEQLRITNSDLEKHVHQLTSGETPLQKAEATNRDLRADSAKFEAHIQQLQEHRAKLTDKLQAEEAERASKAAELASVSAEVESHKAAIAKQELTPADVARMHTERAHLEKELAQLRAHKEELSALQWDKELAISKGIDRIHAKVAQANECFLRLSEVASAQHDGTMVAPPIEVVKDASGGAPYLTVDPVSTSKPPLVRLRTKLSERLLKEQDALLEEETAATRAQEERQRQTDELSTLQAGLARLEREETMMREAHAREIDETNRKAEALHEKIHSSRGMLDTALADAEGELAALRAEHESFVSMAHRSREKMYNQVVGVLDTLLSHKDQLQDQLSEVKAHIAMRAAQLKPLLEAEPEA